MLDARSEMWSILRNNALLDLASGLGKDLRCCCFGLSVSWQMFSIPTSISDFSGSDSTTSYKYQYRLLALACA